MTYTIFITASKLAPAGMQRLESAGCRVLFLNKTQDPTEVESVLATNSVDAIISRTITLSAVAIRSCPTLKVISKHGVGVSNIDVAAATERNIPVYVTPGANAQSVAEMTIGLMLSTARRIPWMDRELHNGSWTRAEDGLQLGGRSLGLVGYGQIGQRVAQVAVAMGMKVIAYDPGQLESSPVPGVKLVTTLEELLQQANVLSLHVPLNGHTRGMIGCDQLALLPPKSIVVNTSRGEVIDEQAMIIALQSGQLFAAGLDTTEQEPILSDNPLLSLENVVLTPHVGGSTPDALAAMATGAVDNVLSFLAGRLPDVRSCVNPQIVSY